MGNEEPMAIQEKTVQREQKGQKGQKGQKAYRARAPHGPLALQTTTPIIT